MSLLQMACWSPLYVFTFWALEWASVRLAWWTTGLLAPGEKGVDIAAIWDPLLILLLAALWAIVHGYAYAQHTGRGVWAGLFFATVLTLTWRVPVFFMRSAHDPWRVLWNPWYLLAIGAFCAGLGGYLQSRDQRRRKTRTTKGT